MKENLAAVISAVKRTMIPVLRKDAEGLETLGVTVVKDAFLPNGKHAHYYVDITDLPDFMIERLVGNQATAGKRRVVATRQIRKPNRREAVDGDTQLLYTGFIPEQNFYPGSVRCEVYEVIRAHAQTPITRDDLTAKGAKYTEYSRKQVSEALSYFIHDTNLIKIVG